MGDAGVVRDRERLPWLEPYRAPPAKPSNRKAGLTAAIGVAGLAAVVTLLTRDLPQWPSPDPVPQASISLPAPSAYSPPIEVPAIEAPVAAAAPATQLSARPARPRHAAVTRRRLTAEPGRDSYQHVLAEQEQSLAVDEPVAEEVLAIAALPLPPDPPRPAVNPAARVVRGKTVQLGVYVSSRQAEAAWRSAIADYTYLVTMPKSIEAIRYGQKRFYRLQLGTPSKQHARQLCSNLKSIGRACTVA